jgi:hypothetical protein
VPGSALELQSIGSCSEERILQNAPSDRRDGGTTALVEALRRLKGAHFLADGKFIKVGCSSRARFIEEGLTIVPDGLTAPAVAANSSDDGS